MKPLKKNDLRWLCCAAFVLSTTQAAWAQTTTTPSGRLLASNCFQCHGTNGKGPGFDIIAGKSASELYNELKEFQTTTEDKGIMGSHAKGYTDDQLKQIAEWLSTQK
jgi:cytochrome subunit of sulfide dehydrogenase